MSDDLKATEGGDAAPEISVIIPVVERVGDLRQLFLEYAGEFRRLGRRAEYLFVVDHRQRHVIPDLRALKQESEESITLLLLRGMFGEAASLTLGLERARGEVFVTLASYFQVDPKGVEQALAELERGADLVIGRRFPRVDPWFNRLQSRVFHWIVRLLTGSRLGDVSCGFRVMRRTLVEELILYGGLHRFLPVIAERSGAVVREIRLPQRKEDTTVRYYGLAVYLKRVLDTATVFFLTKFTQRPLRFFGFLGLMLSLTGLGITGYLGIYRLLQLGPIAGRPLLLLGVLLVVLGIQVLSIGLIGEMIVFTHARQIRHYRVVEILEDDSVAEPPEQDGAPPAT